MFKFLKSVEQQVGRKVTTKWGPREIDLDILFFNDMVFSDEEITLILDPLTWDMEENEGNEFRVSIGNEMKCRTSRRSLRLEDSPKTQR